jgi:ferritin-like metal-binding protein YciE
MKYIGQTGRPFKVRFAEHFRDYKYNSCKSKFAQHLLEHKHSIGPIDEIMEVLYRTNKGKLMDTIEKYHIHKATQLNNQINDKNTIKPNIIFDMIVQANANRERTTI